MPRSPITGLTFLALPALLLCLIPACNDQPKSTPPPTKATLGRMAAESFRSQLGQLPPQIEATTASLTQAANSTGLPRAEAIQSFNRNLTQLKSATSSIVGEVDELRRLGYDEYFLDWSRTQATTADPKVTSARDTYGLVGDYMIQLRRQGRDFLGNLNAAADALAGSPGSNTARLTDLVNQVNTQKPMVLGSIDAMIKEMDRVRPAKG